MGVTVCCRCDNRTESWNTEFKPINCRISNEITNEHNTEPNIEVSKQTCDIKETKLSFNNQKPFVNNNTLNNQSNEQKNVLLNKYLKLFTNETLRQAEKRNENFNKMTYSCYNIPASSIDKLYLEPIYSEIFTIEEENISFYTGEKNKYHQKHGLGTLQFITGEKYEGYWENDIFNLFGRYINKKGELFEGCFSNFQLHGKGKKINEEENFEGDFYFGKKHGKGKEILENEEYEGDFRYNKREGKGILKFKKTNNLYEGEFKDGLMTGNCIFKWANGDRYEGNVIDGIFEGKGKYFWKNGNEYEGNYENGIRNGIGIFKWKEGKIYKGEFQNNLPHGNGVLIDNGVEKPIKFNNGTILNTFEKRKSLKDGSVARCSTKKVSF
jgi:hypothetical protein